MVPVPVLLGAGRPVGAGRERVDQVAADLPNLPGRGDDPERDAVSAGWVILWMVDAALLGFGLGLMVAGR